jgi:hypothetical protein
MCALSCLTIGVQIRVQSTPAHAAIKDQPCHNPFVRTIATKKKVSLGGINAVLMHGISLSQIIIIF